MSDEIIVTGEQTFERELPPTGPTPGICWKVFNIGLQDGKFGPKRKVLVFFEIDVRYTKGDFAGKRMLLSSEYTATLSEKSYLRRDLEKWRGRPFTEEQLKGFNLKKIEGQQALLNIVHKNGYANIDGIMKPIPGSPKLTLEVDPNHVPNRVKNALENQLVDEHARAVELAKTDKIAEKGWVETEKKPAPVREITPEEAEIF